MPVLLCFSADLLLSCYSTFFSPFEHRLNEPGQITCGHSLPRINPGADPLQGNCRVDCIRGPMIPGIDFRRCSFLCEPGKHGEQFTPSQVPFWLEHPKATSKHEPGIGGRAYGRCIPHTGGPHHQRPLFLCNIVPGFHRPS